jgi:ribosomal protein S18 acetylase RimI-like enzyme
MDIVNETNMEQAVNILADAFQDDPVLNWICDRPGSKGLFFRMTLPVFTPHGLTYLDPDACGAASWLGPQQKLKWKYRLTDIWRVVKLGGPRTIYRMAVSGIKTEKFHPSKPHYYLFAIGANSDRRGQGIGTSLITHLLRTCDEEQIPAYLENSKEENLRFYQGHGFEVMEQIRFTKSAPPLWLMWREPKSG